MLGSFLVFTFVILWGYDPYLLGYLYIYFPNSLKQAQQYNSYTQDEMVC